MKLNFNELCNTQEEHMKTEKRATTENNDPKKEPTKSVEGHVGPHVALVLNYEFIFKRAAMLIIMMVNLL